MINKTLVGLGFFVATGLGLIFYSFSDSASSPLKYIAVLVIGVFYSAGLINHIKELKN